MGTSSNQASPSTPNWRVANAVLGKEGASPEIQSRELWRAAVADRGQALVDALASPLLARAVELAESSKGPGDALRSFERVVLDAKGAGLMLDLGKRALARAVAAGTGSAGFASELFSEVAGYYVSRDLPSFTAAPGRVGTISDAIVLKDRVRTVASEAARSLPIPEEPAGWRDYVSSVVDVLRRGGRR